MVSGLLLRGVDGFQLQANGHEGYLFLAEYGRTEHFRKGSKK